MFLRPGDEAGLIVRRKSNMIKQLNRLVPVQIARGISREIGVPIHIVGGAVRDALIGDLSEGDCDFVTGDRFEDITEEFNRRVSGHAIPWDFNQTRIVCRNTAGEYLSVDFSRYKAPDIIGDLELRDFTVNAMAVDVLALFGAEEPKLLDPLGGRRDLGRRLVRMCNPHVFDDDPLRMLRAVRFARQLDFAIDPDTLARCAQKRALIAGVSIERIKKELFTILNLPGPTLSLRQLLNMGIVDLLLPETAGWAGIEQCPPHQFNLLEHCLKTVEQLESILATAAGHIQEHLSEALEEGVTRRSLLAFAAFVHDSGKPAAAKIIQGRLVFHGHDRQGARINREIAERLGLGRRCRRMIERITDNHMRLLQLSLLEKISNRAKLRFLRDCDDVAVEVLLLARADMLATGSDPAYEKQLQQADLLARELLALAFEPMPLQEFQLLNGSDIMQVLALEKGPLVGSLLRQLQQAEREGLIQTRDEALAWLKTKKS